MKILTYDKIMKEAKKISKMMESFNPYMELVITRDDILIKQTERREVLKKGDNENE